jgi:hypothetical protein
MGRSLDPLVRGREWGAERAVFSELYGGFPGARVIARMVRRGIWKYNHYHGEPAELFNMEDDPLEFHNLAEKPACREVREKLEALVLENWHPEEISIKLQEHRERIQYLGRWGRAVNPPDPDQWQGMKPPFPDPWRQNALAIPEYAKWVKE